MKKEIQPLFKWAGGKRRMLEKYDPHFSGLKFDTFVDLFGGSAMMSYWVFTKYPHVKIILNEINPCIVGVYRAIKNNYSDFQSKCRKIESDYLSLVFEKGSRYKKSELRLLESCTEEERASYKPTKRAEYYFNLRTQFNARFVGCDDISVMEDVDACAEMFFLLKTCFNGIWQGSAKTRFSTPAGHCAENRVFDWDVVDKFKRMLDNADIINGSFEDVEIPENAFVYADPPYVSSFTKYDNSFGEKETKRLCDILLKQDMWAMSNKEHVLFKNVFEGVANFHRFDVKYTASRADSDNSSCVEVLVIRNGKDDVIKEKNDKPSLDYFFC